MQVWQKILNNPVLKERFVKRTKIISAIRKFFDSEGFLEVETPLLVQNPGTEPYLEVFKTKLHIQDQQSLTGFLTTSPELNMKKLLSAGMGDIYQICKSFRNQEGMSARHNPEFTILEWYRVDADYTHIMQDCENLFRSVFESLNPDQEDLVMSFDGQKIDLMQSWERLSLTEAFQKYAQVNQEEMLSEVELVKIASKKGYAVDDSTTWEQAFNQILLNEIEPNLGKARPTFLYDYPVSQAALSRKKTDDPRFAERFELYINGLEIANAFSELTDWQEQKKRMEEDLALRDQLGKEKFELDKQFIEALKTGMPPTGGIALGIDRMVMLFLDLESIKDCIFFPVEDVFEIE